jgi:hypothetical protein
MQEFLAITKRNEKPGRTQVAYTCNPRRERLGGFLFKANPGEKLARPYLNQILNMVVHACDSIYEEGHR